MTMPGLDTDFRFEFEGKIGGNNYSIAIKSVLLTPGICSDGKLLLCFFGTTTYNSHFVKGIFEITK